ncbi:alcohol dehydrogenase [Fulvitalea axinellae]|uniref:Alcohol dehydrogenase n=1 Tax=Fulvitalea axinellae TaxID=1182444 RepID=A0AAU9D8F3_9BACT|nr:alcohol dehydrogenase [Fulvitalea axinellae]
MKNIFITGCSSGIGLGLAKHYLAQGHRIFSVSRRKPEALVNEPNFRYAELDLANDSQIAPTVQRLVNGETLDLAILNAGILGEIRDMKDTPVADLQQVMNINVWANKTLLDALLANGTVSQVVGISSGASVNGSRGWSGYSLSKAALNMLVKLYAAENENLLIHALAPGLVDSAMQDYICGEVDSQRFPSAQRLRDARDTPAMPKPDEAGPMLAEAMEKLTEYPNGSFVDVRNM